MINILERKYYNTYLSLIFFIQNRWQFFEISKTHGFLRPKNAFFNINVFWSTYAIAFQKNFFFYWFIIWLLGGMPTYTEKRSSES